MSSVTPSLPAGVEGVTGAVFAGSAGAGVGVGAVAAGEGEPGRVRGVLRRPKPNITAIERMNARRIRFSIEELRLYVKGSNPPRCRGWHRSNRAAARPVPRISPNCSRASIAKSEHVGLNRQDAGNQGETIRW